MGRVGWAKHEELEAFWRFHYDEWARGRLNQREHCELHGLPLKRFGNCRVQFKGEEQSARSTRCTVGAGLDIRLAICLTGTLGRCRQTIFPRRERPRRRAETSALPTSDGSWRRPNGIGVRLLFRWKLELASPPFEPVFLPVSVSDGSGQDGATAPRAYELAPAPIIVDRSPPEIEVELVGGLVSALPTMLDATNDYWSMGKELLAEVRFSLSSSRAAVRSTLTADRTVDISQTRHPTGRSISKLATRHH